MIYHLLKLTYAGTYNHCNLHIDYGFSHLMQTAGNANCIIQIVASDKEWQS